MNLDDMIFFQQVTTRICGSLDIHTTLRNCFDYLKDHMPVNGMAINIYDPHSRSVKNLAMVSDLNDDNIKAFGPVKLSKKAVDFIESLPPEPGGARILNSPNEQAVAHLVWKAMGEPEISMLLLHPIIDEVKLGVVFVFSKGFNRYKPEHAKRFTLLHDPFAMAVSNFLKHQEVLKFKEKLADDNRYLNRRLHEISGDEIIGSNQGLKQVMDMVNQVAPLSSQVLLLGETGVGKEVIANAIHYASSRAGNPFIKVNCGAIPAELIDSELFGHEIGAFTGAVGKKRGRFERADKGTLFLDEIGELPPQAQVRLLRVLQHKQIERVGSTALIPVDIRIIAATHRDLKEMVQAGTFREDLWFRLNVFPIFIPALRDRSCDIPDLIRFLIRRKAKEMNISIPPDPLPASIETLKNYPWPGNVRELENLIERALIFNLAAQPGTPLSFPGNDVPPLAHKSDDRTEFLQEDLNLDNGMRRLIRKALAASDGKVKGMQGAAALLGINPSTLRNRMKKLGISFGRTTVQ
jgi:transcriptional regulator with GAF, ATPase, and Fis domain